MDILLTLCLGTGAAIVLGFVRWLLGEYKPDNQPRTGWVFKEVSEYKSEALRGIFEIAGTPYSVRSMPLAEELAHFRGGLANIFAFVLVHSISESTFQKRGLAIGDEVTVEGPWFWGLIPRQITRINGIPVWVYTPPVQQQQSTQSRRTKLLQFLGAKASVYLSCLPILEGSFVMIAGESNSRKTSVANIFQRELVVGSNTRAFACLIDERADEGVLMADRPDITSWTLTSRLHPEDTRVFAEFLFSIAKRASLFHEVVLFLDSITRLAEIENLISDNDKGMGAGGLSNQALSNFLTNFVSVVGASPIGSLTIIATALLDRTSRLRSALFEAIRQKGHVVIPLLPGGPGNLPPRPNVFEWDLRAPETPGSEIAAYASHIRDLHDAMKREARKIRDDMLQAAAEKAGTRYIGDESKKAEITDDAMTSFTVNVFAWFAQCTEVMELPEIWENWQRILDRDQDIVKRVQAHFGNVAEAAKAANAAEPAQTATQTVVKEKAPTADAGRAVVVRTIAGDGKENGDASQESPDAVAERLARDAKTAREEGDELARRWTDKKKEQLRTDVEAARAFFGASPKASEGT